MHHFKMVFMQIEALHDKKNLIDMITYGIEANKPFKTWIAYFIFNVSELLWYQYIVLDRETSLKFELDRESVIQNTRSVLSVDMYSTELR